VTDPDAELTYDAHVHRLPDLIETRLGPWQPSAPILNLFLGAYRTDSSDGDFFRLDLVLRGLMNPPGDVRPGSFAPFAYGPHPLYGFVELDMDHNVNTGGEFDAPQYRYLGNIVRFGGRISEGPLRGREALDADAFDSNITTPPLVDRSGEEFHLALLGGEFRPSDVRYVVGDSDSIFESGEVWQIRAPFFHRAHGYEDFSFVEGGHAAGEYMPVVTLQFAHDPLLDRTVVSLVFPLTEVGAGLQSGAPPQDWDFDPTNQTSVYEALSDLQFSADFFLEYPSGDPNEALICGWALERPTDFLESEDWDLTVLLGTSYTESAASGVYYVWSDAYPNVVRGDVDGDRQADQDDWEEIEEFIDEHDADDGVVDEAARIAGFAENFSVFDVNHDGWVDGLDLLFREADGDVDDDEDTDLRDFAELQKCYGLETLATPECVGVDLDLSGVTDEDDLPWFLAKLDGPQHP